MAEETVEADGGSQPDEGSISKGDVAVPEAPKELVATPTDVSDAPMGRKMLTFRLVVILGAAALGVLGSIALIQHLADHGGSVSRWAATVVTVGGTLSLHSATLTIGGLLRRPTAGSSKGA